MKTKIITIAVAALTVIALCLAESTGSGSPKPDETAPGTLQEVRGELTKTELSSNRFSRGLRS